MRNSDTSDSDGEYVDPIITDDDASTEFSIDPSLLGRLDQIAAHVTSNLKQEPFVDERECADIIARVKKIRPKPSTHSKKPEESSDLGGQLGHYELLEKIGEGGMGAVYKARHVRLDKEVAIKVLTGHRLLRRSSVERFAREMRAVGKLDHINLIRAMDAGELDGLHYLVMELINGENLSNIIRRAGALPVPDACEIIRQAAVGLDEAHHSEMVHRDLKPSNMMLARTRRGRVNVKVLDMGLALLHEPTELESDLTDTGQLMGTIDYMAPEQCLDSHLVDIRADIYSLGATLYKLLCDDIPLGVDSQTTNEGNSTLKKIKLNTNITSLDKKRSDLPMPLVNLVHQMLSYDRDDRPATPIEVALALTPFTKGNDLAALLDN